MQVKHLLKNKKSNIITTSKNKSLLETAELLTKNNIGAVVITDSKGRIQGILSERDIIKIFSREKHLSDKMLNKNAMTQNLITCSLEDKVDDIMQTMKAKGIRHVPVVEGDKLIGIVSLRDLIDSQLRDCIYEKEMVENYVRSGY